MRDSSLLAFSQLRQEERKGSSHETILAASETFEKTPPTTWRGVCIKLKECVRDLENSEAEAEYLAIELRDFFRSRKTIDGAWLYDLRLHIQVVQIMEPENDYAIACLQSILAGMSKLRLV